MMRLAAVVASLIGALVLTDCSSSSRVEGIVPGWANSHTHAASYAPERAEAGPAGDEAPAIPSRSAQARPGEE